MVIPAAPCRKHPAGASHRRRIQLLTRRRRGPSRAPLPWPPPPCLGAQSAPSASSGFKPAVALTPRSRRRRRRSSCRSRAATCSTRRASRALRALPLRRLPSKTGATPATATTAATRAENARFAGPSLTLRWPLAWQTAPRPLRTRAHRVLLPRMLLWVLLWVLLAATALAVAKAATALQGWVKFQAQAWGQAARLFRVGSGARVVAPCGAPAITAATTAASMVASTGAEAALPPTTYRRAEGAAGGTQAASWRAVPSPNTMGPLTIAWPTRPRRTPRPGRSFAAAPPPQPPMPPHQATASAPHRRGPAARRWRSCHCHCLGAARAMRLSHIPRRCQRRCLSLRLRRCLRCGWPDTPHASTLRGHGARAKRALVAAKALAKSGRAAEAATEARGRSSMTAEGAASSGARSAQTTARRGKAGSQMRFSSCKSNSLTFKLYW